MTRCATSRFRRKWRTSPTVSRRGLGTGALMGRGWGPWRDGPSAWLAPELGICTVDDVVIWTPSADALS